MNRTTSAGLAGALCLMLPAVLNAAPQVPYPAKGQSAERQARDESECATWATQQTGFNPAIPPPPQQTQVTGSGARVKGAAAGAVVGGISGGDAGEAALAGAVVGGVVQRNRNRRANAQQQGAVNAGQAAFAQARSACLSGRGYTMK